MIVTYQGIEFFKMQLGDTVLAFNPVSKESEFKTPRFGADVAFITTNHPDLNGKEVVSLGDKEPFVVSGPGEYEISELFIKGFLSKSEYGGEKVNTVYSLSLDNINICFLGALSSPDLSPEIKEGIGDVDILFVPIGGQGVLNAAESYKLAVKLEPKLIIPMHYGQIGDKDALKIFLKEGGKEGVKAIDKLTVKRKDLDGKEAEIVVLEALN
jgi:hypothetical protein